MIIIHGENQVDSRASFINAKELVRKKNLNITEIAGDELTLDEFIQIVESKSLFGESSVPAIEGFFSRRPSNEKKKICEYLEKNIQVEAIFWDGKDITTQLKNIPATSIKKFDLPKYVFKFLDSLSIADLQATLQNTPAELVMSLLAGHIRKLIMVCDGAINLPAWQAGKLKTQAQKIGMPKLLDMHQQLLKLDYQQKTSSTALDLDAGLELFVIKALN